MPLNIMDWLFNIIAYPFGFVMQFCYWLAQENYIIALFLFSLIIEAVLLPFSIKQQKNSIKAAKLRPKELAIRRRYAGRNDQPTQQKMMQEIQEMQQREGYSPFGGCLPMLIQFPILIALYNIVYNPLNYILGFSRDTIAAILEKAKEIGADVTGITADRPLGLLNIIRDKGVEAFSSVEGFSDKISSVSDLPNMSIGAFDLSLTPNLSTFNWLLLVPVLTFVVYYFSMKLNRKFSYQPASGADDRQTACSNNIMDISMPLMSVFFTFMVPAAIGVYWIFKSILSTVKQFILSRIMKMPQYTEEDIKAAERELYGKNAGKAPKKERDPNRPKVRSLHHIDDEDYEVISKEEKAAIRAQRDTEAQTALPVEQAPVKKDDRKHAKTEENAEENK